MYTHNKRRSREVQKTAERLYYKFLTSYVEVKHNEIHKEALALFNKAKHENPCVKDLMKTVTYMERVHPDKPIPRHYMRRKQNHSLSSQIQQGTAQMVLTIPLMSNTPPTCSSQPEVITLPLPPPEVTTQPEEVTTLPLPPPEVTTQPEEVTTLPLPPPEVTTQPEEVTMLPLPPPEVTTQPEEVTTLPLPPPEVTTQPEEVTMLPLPPPEVTTQPEEVTTLPLPPPEVTTQPEEVTTLPLPPPEVSTLPVLSPEIYNSLLAELRADPELWRVLKDFEDNAMDVIVGEDNSMDSLVADDIFGPEEVMPLEKELETIFNNLV